MTAKTGSIAFRMPPYHKPKPALHTTPNEILSQVMARMPDVESLFAFTRVNHHFYSIFKDDKLSYITKATLSTLASRNIHILKYCQFAHIAMRGGREPSMYLYHAILAIFNHQTPCTLTIPCCRALLDIAHLTGYDEWPNTDQDWDDWKWEVVMDEGRTEGMDTEESYPCGKENYHILFFEHMTIRERLSVREHLTPDKDLSLRVYTQAAL